MPFDLSRRLLAGVAVIAVLANFVVYQIGTDSMVDAASGWRESSVSGDGPGSLDPNVFNANIVRGFLGSQSQGNSLISSNSQSAATAVDRTLVYEGVTYRLTGLVVNGLKSAATLISDASDPVRVTVGGQLPGGQEIRAITLNEIVVINSEGFDQSIRIYE